MTNTEILIIIGCAFITGAIAIGIHRLKYKKSIVFNITAIMVSPILLGCIIGLIVGAKGIAHFLWAIPATLGFNAVCYGIIARMMRGPLNEMLATVDSLSKGDMDVTINEKFQKGEHELAQMMRLLLKLTSSLRNIAAFADHVGKGELNTKYELLGEDDSLGKSMLDMRANLQKTEAEMERRKLEDERRGWVTQGVAKFADLLRANNDNIEELCNSIVSNLVRYIGANQAGIFILSDDDTQNPALELKACYAYDRRKFFQRTIGLGDGLVGTCFRERDTIYMTRLPKDYISITSGLGGETPSALLIVPLKLNEEVYGVLEIASFKEFEPHVREFVEKLSESIASTISSVKVNIRTNKLLTQSKLQAEGMANQEEELRQNMEEMQATQDEMRRREGDMQGALEKMQSLQEVAEEKEYEMQQFYDAIFETCNVIEFSPQAVILDANQKLLNLFGVEKEEIIGKHLSKIIGDEAFNAAKTAVRQGINYEDVQQITNGSGKKITIIQKFMPIHDKKGELLRVLYLAFHDQDADMRQNMEEIREAQTASKEKELELQQFYNAFNDSCHIIIYSAEGVITDVNEKLLKLFNIPDKSVWVGLRMTDFIGEEKSRMVMEQLAQGKSYEECQEIDTGAGEKQIFRQKFTPICDSQGKLLWILLITTPENN